MAAERKANGSAVWPLAKTAFFFAVVPGTVAGYVPYWMLLRRGLWRVPEPGLLEWLGAALMLAGAAGLAWCGWHFAVTGRGTPAPFDPPRHLVVKGLYRHTRNPMYVSVAAVLIGESLLFSAPVLFGYLAACWVFIHLFVLLYEEPTLRYKFGDAYDAYCRAVPRWIPRIRPWSP
jgi:protein-S-isoprenylcysteine O-methyltransferase Ste14